MGNQVLGMGTCPVCKSEYSQEVRLSEKSNKPYINCEECGAQVFARQPLSVKLLRGLVDAPAVIEMAKIEPVPLPAAVLPAAPVVKARSAATLLG